MMEMPRQQSSQSVNASCQGNLPTPPGPFAGEPANQRHAAQRVITSDANHEEGMLAAPIFPITRKGEPSPPPTAFLRGIR